MYLLVACCLPTSFRRELPSSCLLAVPLRAAVTQLSCSSGGGVQPVDSRAASQQRTFARNERWGHVLPVYQV